MIVPDVTIVTNRGFNVDNSTGDRHDVLNETSEWVLDFFAVDERQPQRKEKWLVEPVDLPEPRSPARVAPDCACK